MTHRKIKLEEKKRIIIIFDATGYGGAGESLFTAVKNLRYTYNLTVALSGPGPLADRLRNIGIQVDFVKMESWRWWVRTTKQLLKHFLTLPLQFFSLIRWIFYLNTIKPDIVHFNINRLIEPVIAARILRIPSIIHFRDITSKMRYKFAFGWPMFFYFANFADRWIANSNAVRDDISPFGKVPIQVIHNGLDIEEFDNRSAKKCEIELPKDNIKIAILGGINPWKKQKEFIKIAIRLLKIRKDIIFYVIGGIVVESYFEELKKMVNDSDNSMNIIFTGNVQNTAAVLKNIDIMLHTMPYESFGRVFIEAMAAKVPVITYNSGGAKDIVQHGKTGLLVGLRNVELMIKTVNNLADDTDLRQQMGEAGRKCVEEKFSINKHCSDVSDVYQDLLNGNLISA